MHVFHLEAAEEMRRNRDQFLRNVTSSMRGGNVKGVTFDKVLL
jgi:ubiquitin-conjugating enzyme E2 M